MENTMRQATGNKLTIGEIRNALSTLPKSLFVLKIQPLDFACSAEFDERLPFNRSALDKIFARSDAFGVRELAVNVDCNGLSGEEDPMAHYIVHMVVSAPTQSEVAKMCQKLGKAFKWSALPSEPSVIASSSTLQHAAETIAPFLRQPVGEYWLFDNVGISNIRLNLTPHYQPSNCFTRRPLSKKMEHLLDKLENADGDLKLIAYGKGIEVRDAIMRTIK